MPVSCTVKDAVKFLKAPIKRPLLINWDESTVGACIQDSIDEQLCYWAAEDSKLTDLVIGRRLNENKIYVVALKSTKSRIKDFIVKFLHEYPNHSIVAHRRGKLKTYDPAELWKRL